MKGICFIEPLFHKVVKGQKTQTRRIIVSRTGYFQVASKNGIVTEIWQTDANEWCGDNLVPVKPKYKVGEIVYLKEPHIIYTEEYQELKDNFIGLKTAYKYGNHLSIQDIVGNDSAKWKNKLFMPESAARYFIKITGVRAEKLQDISDEDCLKEGIFEVMGGALNMNGIDGIGWLQPNDAYAALIDKINGKGTWKSNPWVWVYDFELTNN